MEIHIPATAKMAAEAVNLCLEAKMVNFSKKEKYDNKFKNNRNFNLKESNWPLDNGASDSDGKAAQKNTKTMKCYLCDGNLLSDGVFKIIGTNCSKTTG